MYRNSKDKRVQQTASQLYDAILALLAEGKAFESIGIKEVSARAGIGRATFYRNFDYVDDVLKYQLDHLLAQLKAEQPPERFKSPDTLLPFFEFWVRHADILKILVKANRWELFAEQFRQATNTELPIIIEDYGLDARSLRFLEQSVNSLITSTLYTWLTHGCHETAVELQQLFILPFQIYVERTQLTATDKHR